MFDDLKKSIDEESEAEGARAKVISNQTDMDILLSSFDKKDKEIQSILDDLVSVSDTFDNDLVGNLRKVTSMEFLLVRVRMLVTRDLTLCNSILAQGQNVHSPQTLAVLKKRVPNLISLTSRLNEIREDYNSIQKICYTQRMQTGL